MRILLEATSKIKKEEHEQRTQSAATELVVVAPACFKMTETSRRQQTSNIENYICSYNWTGWIKKPRKHCETHLGHQTWTSKDGLGSMIAHNYLFPENIEKSFIGKK